MRFLAPHCPDCGQLARGTADIVPCCATVYWNGEPGPCIHCGAFVELHQDTDEWTAPGDVECSHPDGHARTVECEYAGDTEVFWDGQTNDRPEGTTNPNVVALQCRCGHVWITVHTCDECGEDLGECFDACAKCQAKAKAKAEAVAMIEKMGGNVLAVL